MKKISFLICLSILQMIGFAQTIDTAATTKKIKLQADSMSTFFIEKNYKPYCQFIYPKLLSKMGGAEKMIAGIKGQLKQMESEGVKILKVSIAEPAGIVVNKNEWQAVVEQLLELKIPDGRMQTKSALIAISTDKGINWKFLDTSGKDLQTIRTSFPNISPALMMPANTKPVYIKD